MTTGELERIEKELELVLPHSYREFMQSGKFGEGYGGNPDLTGVAEEIIEMNKDLRENGFFGAKWPDNFLVIGDDGAGDYYFMDVKKQNPVVLFADHELTTNKDSLVIKEKYKTVSEFWEFLRQVTEAQKKWENRRWWQILTRPMRFTRVRHK
jgi:hypothetical protein